jgi:hypothetical protein
MGGPPPVPTSNSQNIEDVLIPLPRHYPERSFGRMYRRKCGINGLCRVVLPDNR